MAATWAVDDVRFVNQARREIAVTATRTDGTVSHQYRLPSFIMRRGVAAGIEGDRLAADLKTLADADKTWGSQALADLFPDAATALAVKLDALET